MTRFSNSHIVKEPAAGRPIPDVLPVLPLHGLVVFPHMMIPLSIGREKSIRALDLAMEQDRMILLVAQRNGEVEDPSPADLFQVGTAAEPLQVLRLPDGTVRVMVEGAQRVRVVEFQEDGAVLTARVEVLEEVTSRGLEAEAYVRHCRSQFEEAVQLGKSIPPEVLVAAANIDDPGRLADLIASYTDLKVLQKQEILEIASAKDRLERLDVMLAAEVHILRLGRDIDSRVQKEVEGNQKEYFLRERMKAIQEELGERDSFSQEVEELKAKVEKAGMAPEALEKAMQEIARLERMPPIAPEGTVIRTYLEWLIDLPWANTTRDHLDIERAERILDEDHYGLSKVKERVVEFLAVRKLNKKVKGPILCFVGPPGVGKTSIGKSIARSLGRKFARVSLGGIRDEAEIRGHRRTYVGAMPGRIIQTLRRTKSRNPVFMLDEIDKIGMDFRGDPSSALLEALDPEQNFEFSDHYLEVPFDLSDVMFIATGNILDTIPPALQDRLEVLHFPGYTEDEKLCIARQFLVPKQIKEHGVRKSQLQLPDRTIRAIINQYTREAGVRNLEREIASICRKTAKKIASGDKGKTIVTGEALRKLLGAPRFRTGKAEEKDEIAVATGLAWTEAGGEVLSVEVSLLDGKGNVTLTGQLGDVMQESARAAISYTRAVATRFGVRNGRFYDKTDVHIHVPAGAIPKDGPSAGTAMATALVSAISKRAVRKDVAMTGEVTLRGKVLPVGGVKEKILAAHRAGLKEVILPKANQRDMDDIPANVRRKLKFHFFDNMDDVLTVALFPAPRRSRSAGQVKSGGR